MAQPMALPYSYFADANGAPLAGGKVYTYIAGTTTPQNSYTDSTGITPAANPVILDSAGRAEIWLSGYYKIIIKDSLDNIIHTTDNITALGSTGDMNKSVYDAANIQEQLVGLTAVQTITNKTLTAPTITNPVITEGAWTSYTPTITSGSGTFTTTSATGRYRKQGRTVQFEAKIIITTVGTASGIIICTLPIGTTAATAAGSGMEDNNVNCTVSVGIPSGGTTAIIRKYDASSIIGATNEILISATYETTT